MLLILNRLHILKKRCMSNFFLVLYYQCLSVIWSLDYHFKSFTEYQSLETIIFHKHILQIKNCNQIIIHLLLIAVQGRKQRLPFVQVKIATFDQQTPFTTCVLPRKCTVSVRNNQLALATIVF